jgi:hypothetical protein
VTAKRTLLAMLVVVSMVGSLFAAPALAAGDITVNVADDDGDDLDGATVTLYDAADGSEVATKESTNGSATFSSTADGDYYVEVSKTDYASTTSSTKTISGSAVTFDTTLTENMTELENGTVSLSDDTNGLYGEATVDGSTDVTVTYYGIENGSETQLSTETLSPAAGETAYSEHSLTDSELGNYSEARVVVEAQASDVNSSDFGSVMTVSGGGGSGGMSFLSGTTFGLPNMVIIIAAGVLGLMVLGDD